MAAPVLYTSILTGGTNNHPTSSEEVNGFATDFASEGVVGTVSNTSGVAPSTGSFAVNASGTPDTNINISTGVAYVTTTPSGQNSQLLRVRCTTAGTLAIASNSSGSTKYDWIYLSVDATNANNPNTAGDNVATVVASRSTSAASDDGTPPTYGTLLAVVTVANGFTTITNANIRDARSQVAITTGASSASTDGWQALSNTVLSVSSGYNKGNKEYEIATSTDLSSTLSAGMRLKFARSGSTPTQCTDLEASSSQYASRTSASVSGITFTDDFAVEGWIRLESYGQGRMLSRFNGSSGWGFMVDASGRVALYACNAGGGNFSQVLSYQSLPLNRWVHVAAQLDMSAFSVSSTTSYIMLDGTDIPAAVSRGGTNPTSLVQAGNLELGAENSGTQPFDGKLSDIRLWSAKRTQTQIRDNMNQQLVGNETNLVAYFKLNGNFNDSTSNANNLTGQNSAVATSSDNPMNSTEYGIITKVTTTAITLFTGTSYNVPNATLQTPYYSTQKAPYGFDASRGKWRVDVTVRAQYNTGSIASSSTTTNIAGLNIIVPTGSWELGISAFMQATAASAAFLAVTVGLSTTNNSFSDSRLIAPGPRTNTATGENDALHVRQAPVSATSATTYYVNTQGSIANTTQYINGGGSFGDSIFYAECAYV